MRASRGAAEGGWRAGDRGAGAGAGDHAADRKRRERGIATDRHGQTRKVGLEPSGEHPNKLLFRDVTEKVIGAAFEVRKRLGFGFLEKVCQRALQAELLRSGATAVMEHPIPFHYKGVNVGEYFADLLVDGVVVVEIKVSPEYSRHDEAQLLNELKATGLRVGKLLNFGRTKLEFKRLVL